MKQNSELVVPRDEHASSTFTLDVSCSAGKKVLGGGGTFVHVAGMVTQPKLLGTEPVGSTGWRAIADTEGAADPKGSIQYRLSVWAICATVG